MSLRSSKPKVSMRKQWADKIKAGADLRCLTAGIADRLESYAIETGDEELLKDITYYWGEEYIPYNEVTK